MAQPSSSSAAPPSFAACADGCGCATGAVVAAAAELPASAPVAPAVSSLASDSDWMCCTMRDWKPAAGTVPCFSCSSTLHVPSFRSTFTSQPSLNGAGSAFVLHDAATAHQRHVSNSPAAHPRRWHLRRRPRPPPATCQATCQQHINSISKTVSRGPPAPLALASSSSSANNTTPTTHQRRSCCSTTQQHNGINSAGAAHPRRWRLRRRPRPPSRPPPSSPQGWARSPTQAGCAPESWSWT